MGDHTGIAAAPGQRRPYHHGNLREALIEAGSELARVGGPDAVVLREVSRAAGVSHNAAYRHFADREALVEAVRERCFAALGARMQQALASAGEPGGDRRTAEARLGALGREYVAFALDEPGWFRTAFGPSQHWEQPSPGNPYELLSAALDDLVASGAMPPGRRANAEVAAWSAVHGLSCLLIEGPLGGLDPEARREAVDKVTAFVVDGLER